MPNHSDILFKVAAPENYEPPMTFEVAREKGFTDFTFYPTADEATEAAAIRALETGRRTVTFTETVMCGRQKYPLYVMGEMPRPKPRVTRMTRPEAIAAINARCRPYSPRLNAFAVFMGEWAAKLKKVVR